MIQKFLSFLGGKQPSEMKISPGIKRPLSYEEKFNRAIEFSNTHAFAADCEISSFEQGRVDELVQELTNIIPNFLNIYPKMGFKDVITRFGGDCGTVHFSILNFINQHYRDLPINITLGEVNYSSCICFNFNEEKCKDWISNGSPEIFDCHAWLTVGNDLIIDVTIGTYVNTRIDPDKKSNKKNNIFGGITYGNHGNFKHIPIAGLLFKALVELNTLRYSPVVVGAESLLRLAPIQPLGDPKIGHFLKVDC